MAAELKAQRAQLERTHRLEAWAEMARQVAHEIKNPLTPIQLSAEHLRRVHADRGEPMGPVLENCVTSILGQVRLLRQISSEFSSFASSPTARRAPVALPELVAEVVDPYRTGLAGADRDRQPGARRRCRPCSSIARSSPARSRTSSRTRCTRCRVPARLTIDGSRRGRRRFGSTSPTPASGWIEEALERVFEPYFSTKTTGTGLGLPIARRNIELSGGSIEVRSAKGAGTTVIVRLPLADSVR